MNKNIKGGIPPQLNFITMFYERKVFNAPLQAIVCSSIKFTLSRCNSAGLKSVPFSKSVNSDNVGWTRTSAINSSPQIPRKCSAARAPPVEP